MGQLAHLRFMERTGISLLRRPLPFLESSRSARLNLWSAYRRKISPRTETEYSEAISLELALNS